MLQQQDVNITSEIHLFLPSGRAKATVFMMYSRGLCKVFIVDCFSDFLFLCCNFLTPYYIRLNTLTVKHSWLPKRSNNYIIRLQTLKLTFMHSHYNY